MAYADPSDLIARFDRRDIADLASDTGIPVTALATDPKILAALSDASGRINSCVMVSGMYTAADLASLTGDDLAYLKRLTCVLAISYLLGNRIARYGEALEKLVEKSEQDLELIRQGKNLFNLDAQKEAGLPSIDGPSIVQYRGLNLLRDRAKGYYPARKLPLGRGAD